MPKNKNAAFRYEIIDKLLRKSANDRLCKEDLVDRLNEYLEIHCDEKGVAFNEVSTRTVMQDIKYMQQDYGVKIKIERNYRKSAWYSYENEFVSIYNTNGLNSVQAHDIREALRRLRSFISHDQFSFLTKGRGDSNGAFRELWELFMPKNEHTDFLLDRGAQVLVDRAPEEYEGARWINKISEATSLQRILRIKYKPFNKTEKEFDFHPSVLKQYNNRWFSFGHDPDFTLPDNDNVISKFRNIALDRIKSIHILNNKELEGRVKEGNNRGEFKKLNIDWEVFFSKIIGVSIDLTDFKKGQDYINTEEIRIAFHPTQIGYEITKPLHDSVKDEKPDTEDGWSIRKYELYVNPEFYSQVFHFGNKVRILSPEWLVEDFKIRIQNMKNNYDL